MVIMLCDKYAPTTLNGIVGNKAAIDKISEFGLKAQEDGKEGLSDLQKASKALRPACRESVCGRQMDA